jgi:hypothetical protein
VARIEISETTLTVLIEGADKLWSIKSRLDIPLEHVVDAREGTERIRAWMGLWRTGTHIPGVIAAGTFHQDGEAVFWDVHHPEQAVEIELRDERYSRLVIEVEDRGAVIAAVREALGLGGSGG